jgi:putative ABC transport system substrate-binding protein
MRFDQLRRREFIALLGGAAATWSLAASAQQVGKTYRIGFLANDPTIPMQAAGKAFLDGLREHGFVEGKNIVIERRFAQGSSELASELAAELVRLNVDLVVVSGQNNAAAMKQATRLLPVVMVNVFDPIGMGIVGSLASLRGEFHRPDQPCVCGDGWQAPPVAEGCVSSHVAGGGAADAEFCN